VKKLAELDDATISVIAESNPGDIAIYKITDMKLVPLFSSAGLAELSGMTPGEYTKVIQNNAAAMILKQDLPLAAEKISATLNGGEDTDLTYRIVHKTQGHIWVHAKGRLIGTRDGSPVIMVTYSRSSYEAAGHSRLLDISATILYVVDRRSYEILFANDTALRQWGRTDYTGMACYEFVNDCHQPCPWCSIPLMKDGRYHSQAAYSPVQDKWFSIDCRELDWYGRSAVAIYASDVTEQQKHQRDIQADRDNLDTILGSIPGGVAIFSDRGGAIQLDYTNSGFYELHKGSREYWSGQSNDPVNWLLPEDRALFEEEFKAVKSGARELGNVVYRVAGEDGEPHWVNNQFRRAYVRDGVQYYYASFVGLDGQIAAENARKEARRMYEAAVEATNLVVWEYDIDNHRIIMAENEFTEYDYRKFGLPKVTENAPQALVPYIDDAYVDTFLEMYRKIDSGAPSAACEVWYKLRPGTEPRCEKISYTTEYGRDGKPVKAYGIGQNITAHKREEESYKQAIRDVAQSAGNTLGSFSLNLTKNWCGDGKSRYDSVLRQQDSGTADGYFLAFSNSIADEDIRKKSLRLLTREGLIEKFLRGETQISVDYPVRYSSGEVHWHQGIMNMMRNPHTGDVEAVTHALDIDRAKRGEQIAASVLKEKLDCAAIIYPVSGIIDFYSVQTDIIRIVPGVRYEYEEIRSYMRDCLVAPEDILDFDEHTLLGQVIRQLDEQGVCQVYYKCVENEKESFRHMQYSWLDSARTAVLAIQEDVTESHLLEQQRMEELRQALASAEKANSAKTEFLSRMSHDIRTPLNGIIGMTYIAGTQNNPPKTADCLSKIDMSSKFLLGLINDVLDMTKAESGAIELNPEPYEPKVFFSYLDSVIAPLCREKGIRFVVEARSEDGVVPLMDPLRINQVFFNLLSNAVKFTPEGGTVIYRLKEHKTENGRLALDAEVRDSGIGMSDEFQKVLFEPFTQEGRSDNSENRGTGLGLSIVKKLMDLMGCTITVESRIGEGTVFRLYGEFDCVPEEETNKSAFEEAEKSKAALDGRHVLLCEDHPLNQEIAKALLEGKNMTVTIADDGEQGVEKFRESSPGFYDVVLMDIRMPVMDGYEAARQLRALPRRDAETVPIIAMTADAFAEDVQKCREAGMNDHIAKPLDITALYDTLAKYMT